LKNKHAGEGAGGQEASLRDEFIAASLKKANDPLPAYRQVSLRDEFIAASLK
jgi:hypothetical protein